LTHVWWRGSIGPAMDRDDYMKVARENCRKKSSLRSTNMAMRNPMNLKLMNHRKGWSFHTGLSHSSSETTSGF